MENAEWLAALKVGDMVAQCSGAWLRTYAVFAVERLTPTQVIAGGRRFKRKNGYPIEARGRPFGARYAIEPLTPEIKAVNELASLKSWFDNLRSSGMELSELRAMKQAYEAAQGAK